VALNTVKPKTKPILQLMPFYEKRGNG
jgi:hypothetical protein